jgi:hypothetical protein
MSRRELTADFSLATAGLIVLRSRGGLTSTTRPHPDDRQLVDTLRLPVPTLLVLTQAIGYVVVAVQLYMSS